MLRKVISSLLWVGYCVAATWAILYFFFWPDYRDYFLALTPPEIAVLNSVPVRHVDAETMKLLGIVVQEKESSFVNFAATKPSGTVRVCALGDSWTQGSEVTADSDYPSQLQRLFDTNGYENVEVVNFGNSNYGFSQIFVMWRNVATKFACDFVTLLPMGFWSLRDTTFKHDGFANLHARFVMEHKELRLLAPIGNTVEERIEGYLRPIPRWQYLRYDRQPPNLFAASIPRGRYIPNPFYYDSRSRSAEVEDIYAEIIGSIARGIPQVVVIFHGPQGPLYPKLISDRSGQIGAALLDRLPRGFPYVAPGKHPTHWGHELLATAFYRLLTGNPDTSFSLVDIRDELGVANGSTRPLHAFRQVRVTHQGKLAGYFLPTQLARLETPKAYQGKLAELEVAALLALMPVGGSLADACLVPLKTVPANGSSLFVETDNADLSLSMPTEIEQLQARVALFRAVVPGSAPWECMSAGGEAGQARRSEDVLLWLAGQIIARVIDGVIYPEHGPVFSLRNDREYRKPIASLALADQFYIDLQSDNGERIIRPLMTIEAIEQDDYLKIKIPPTRIISQSLRASKRGMETVPMK